MAKKAEVTLDYVEAWKNGRITSTELANRAAADLVALDEEYADHIKAAAQHEKLRNGIKAAIEDAVRKMGGGEYGDVRFTVTAPEPKQGWDSAALQQLMDDMAAAGSEKVSGGYVAQRLAEAKRWTTAASQFRVERIKK